MSPGLLRAREPFFLRNAITGAVLVSFATWVYWYSISAVCLSLSNALALTERYNGSADTVGDAGQAR